MLGDNIITTNVVVTFILKLVNGETPENQDGDSNIAGDELLEEDELIRRAEALNRALPFAHAPFYPGVSVKGQVVGLSILLGYLSTGEKALLVDLLGRS